MQKSEKLSEAVRNLEKVMPELKDLVNGQGSAFDYERVAGKLKSATDDVQAALTELNKLSAAALGART